MSDTPAYQVFDGSDQVTRLEEFRAAHPEWDITYDKSLGLWRASRGDENHSRYWLGHLIDALESL